MEISTHFLVEYEWASQALAGCSWDSEMMGIQATQAIEVLEVLENHCINIPAGGKPC